MLQSYRNVTRWCEAMDQHIVKHKPEQEVKLIKSQSFLVLSVAHYTVFCIMSLEIHIHSELSFNTHLTHHTSTLLNFFKKIITN